MRQTKFFICVLFLEVFISCTYKDINDIASSDKAPIAKIQIVENTNQFMLDGGQSSDPDGDSLTYSWSASSVKITIIAPTSKRASFFVPVSSQSFTTDITLSVNDGIRKTQSSQTILVPSVNQSEAYGLGHQLSKGISNNTNYEWYFDQANSGTYALVNCGPASVTMAIKWADKKFALSPQDARQMYRPTGGWWFTDDILNYLNHYNINNEVIGLTNINLLKSILDNGNIIILCLDMYYVDYQTNDSFHFSKFYEASTQGWGHFIVIKGYKEVDDQTFFEAYDPYSFGSRYSDSSIKGKDRYYKAANLDSATNNWWDYAIIVRSPNSSGRLAAIPNSIDPKSIEHKSGR